MSHWTDRAACLGHDPETWFSDTAVEQAEAKRVCGTCPVISQCREAARGQHAGIWAGVDLADRRTNRQAAQRDHRLAQARERNRIWYVQARAAKAAYEAGDRSQTTLRMYERYTAMLARKREQNRRRREGAA